MKCKQRKLAGDCRRSGGRRRGASVAPGGALGAEGPGPAHRIPAEPAGTGLGSRRAAARPGAPAHATAEPCRVRGTLQEPRPVSSPYTAVPGARPGCRGWGRPAPRRHRGLRAPGRRPRDHAGGPACGEDGDGAGVQRRGLPQAPAVRPSRSHPIGPAEPRGHVARRGGRGWGTRAATCSWLLRC